MSAVRTADLKNNLSRHLARVRRGHTITVLDRDTPVARLIPFVHGEPGADAGTESGDRLREMAKQGVLTLGEPRALAKWIETHRPVKRRSGGPAGSELLLDARRNSTR